MKYLKLTFAFVLTLLMTSCLTSGLEDLETYEGNDITNVYAYYRYKTNETIPASGEYKVKQVTLTVEKTLNNDAATADVIVKLPSNFPADQKDAVSAANLVIATNISTAAVMEPVDGAPALGAPADWSTPHKYKVTSAAGEAKVWTIKVTLEK